VATEHKKMTTRIKLRRDTAANWVDANPILAAGEPGLETDTGKIKYGDGVTAWSSLAHAGGNTLNDDGSVTIAAGSTQHWVATQRRENEDTQGCALRYDSEGNLYSLARSFDGNDNIAVITKYSPTGAVLWQHSIDDLDPQSLAVDSADCVYMSGETGAGINLFKFDTDGTVLWKKFYSVTGSWIGKAFIEELNSSSIILVGSTEVDSIETGSGIVLKINSSTGAVIAQKTITNDGSNAYVHGIDVTDNGQTIFVTGWYYDNADDKNKMFIDKLDANLTRAWTKSLESPGNYNMSGGDCASDAYGNIYATGTYEVLIQPNLNSNNSTGRAVILTKLNASGVVQWTRRSGPGPCGNAEVGLSVSSDDHVYLLTMTTVRKTSDGTDNDYDMAAEAQDKMILVKYDLSGNVVWQRHVDARNVMEERNEEWPGLCVATFEGKLAVDFYGYSWSSTPFEFGGSDDNEYDYFVTQLPADGTELTIGKLDFIPSYLPGRFVTHVTTDSPTTYATLGETILVETSELALDAAARIANDLVNSEVYEYVFGADGTLTIPNDGDVKLTQTQLGYLMTIGAALNYDDGIQGRAVTADADGNMYVAGEEDDDSQPFVVKINPQGEKVWNITIEDDEDSNNGQANGITIDPTTGNVIVVCEMYGDNTYSIVVKLDQDTGRILGVDRFRDIGSDVYLNDVVAINSNTYVVAGSKFGEFSPSQNATPVTGSVTSTLIVSRSAINGTPTTNWQISGNGFSTSETISYVENYNNLASTVRQGSGATFDIIDNGNGTYSAGIVNGGTNYLAGHKIQISGSVIGGVDVTNDITITVDAANAGVITGLSSSGAAAGNASQTYSALSGTNYNVGSGATFNFRADPFSSTYSSYDNFSVSSGGSNYVDGDVITIAGTQLGGTSPTNNLTCTAYTGGTGSVIAGNDPTGNAQTSTWQLTTSTAVDFSAPGAWTLSYPLSRENFLATPTWQRTFGTNAGDYTDRLYAVAVDSAGNIITVGEGYGAVSPGNNDDLATVFKFNSSGTLQWARQLNETNDDCYAKSVTTIGTDIYVTHRSIDDDDTVITKLSANGTVVWQRITESNSDSTVVNAGDGNILVVTEAYNADNDNDAIKIIKMTPSGETVYKRWLSAASDEDSQFTEGRCLAVAGDSFYVTGYFYADDYDSAFAAKLPINGDGTGEYGSFRYADVNTTDNNYNWSTPNGVNFNVNEVALDGGYAGALAVAPYVNTGTTVTVAAAAGDFYVNLYDVPYHVEVVRDTDGGRIVFADGSTQNTSAQDIPQRIYTGQRYTLGLVDRGHHIYCREQNDSIIIPYDARVPFKIGTVITIVNYSGSSVYINTEGGSTELWIAGDGDNNSVELFNYGIATLLKVEKERWVISGNVQSN
jgi:hypothetical protein